MSSAMASLVNLQSVGTAQRAALWARSAARCFPGISVHKVAGRPEAGRIASMSFGSGRIWSVLSPPLVVNYDPATGQQDRNLFSVMIQLAGTTAARQQRRACLLRAGDSCAIDNGAPFELEVSEGISNLIILQIPRLAVLGRHPYLERCTAERFDAHEAGTGLLRSLLMSSLDGAAALEDQQRSAALAAIIELLGAARCVRSEPPEEQVGWRIRAAQQLIGEHFADPALNASQIARVQGISRRRLDTLMIRATGGTLTAQIWNRRLAQAANDLDDPRCAARGVSQLAFAAGFVDSAHFSRAFRRAFQCTPSEWRERRRNDATDRSAPQTPPRPTLRPRAVRR